MAKRKLIPTDGFGSARELPKIEAYKAKPKPWIEGPISRRVRLERERHFWKNNVRDRKDIEEYVALMKAEWAKQDKNL